MRRMRCWLCFCTAAALLPPAAADDAAIDIVGSSTVYPFSTVVAERFSQITGGRAPKVESTGSGGGLQLFCSGAGASTPDITNASRRIKKSEQDKCAANGVDDIIEVKIGYDGIVIAQSLGGAPYTLTRREVFLALAKQVPDAAGNLVDNPHQTWQEVNPALPAIAIRVYGPPPTSGTRDAFAELVLEEGCKTFDALRAIKNNDKKRYHAICHGVREDGAYIEVGENDNLIVQKLVAASDSLGVFGYSFLEENQDKVRSVAIDGVVATFEAIADGSYPVSRPLYFYAKKAHYAEQPDLADFVEFFVSEEMMGEDGELAERGLIPLPEAEYATTVDAATNQQPMPPL